MGANVRKFLHRVADACRREFGDILEDIGMFTLGLAYGAIAIGLGFVALFTVVSTILLMVEQLPL